MIAKLCAILLCCFALILNTKTMETTSNSQITPARFFVPTSDKNYVRAVDNVKTFNKQSTTINKQSILSMPVVNDIEKYQKKIKSRDRLEKKAGDIKCTFCVIAKSNAVYLKYLLESFVAVKRFSYDDDDLHKLRQIQLETTMIVELLLAENLETGKWLWSHFLKTIAIAEYDDFKNGFKRDVDPFESDRLLQTGVSEFIGTCIREKNLPETAMAPDFVSNNPKGHGRFLNGLSAIPLTTNRNYNLMLTLLYLAPFWEDRNEFLFRQIAYTNVDWNVAKQKHLTEVPATRTFFENNRWIYTPYERMDHQLLLVRIIDARLYCHLAVVLRVYEKQLTAGRFEPRTLRQTKDAIADVVQDVLQLTAFKDHFLVSVISDLKTKSDANIEEIKKMSTEVKAKANEVLNKLHGSSGVDRLGLNVNQLQSSNELTALVIKNFKDYMNELKRICLPFEYRWLLHFLDLVKWSS
ncbi:uncharacterized protein LOC126836332 isoform X4 [Adelges cooleyi]|uniref:uncharacterized protein LOC126836332 isoform X4 n=1 Tax=Adelges cooleyi TaxID=133065 RepID=UPI0021802551|nr:uncharacterized protein LOC126836332 isoform X4 [Adelges cooleyi]